MVARRGRAALLLLLCSVVAPAAGCNQPPLVLAVDREVASTGLVEKLLELAPGAGPVQVVSGSTGEVLLRGAQAQADLLLVAAPAEVERLAGQGRVARQQVLLHNEYVLVGRDADPARIRGMSDAALALRQVNRTGATFAVPSRGTAARFKLEQLWKLQTDRRISPSFLAVQGGAQEAVLAAHAQSTYALVDRATRLTYMEAKSLKPKVLLRGGPEMANPYHLLLLVPAPGRSGLAERGRALFEALCSASAARVITGYGVTRYGEPLFDAGPPEDRPVRAHDQLPPLVLPGSAPLRPGAEHLPDPHQGPGGLPMTPPHGPMIPHEAMPSPHGAMPPPHGEGQHEAH